MTDRRSTGLLLFGGLLCCSLGLLTAFSAHRTVGRYRGASAGGAPFTCDGPNDLIVERGRITLHGTHVYGQVCVRDGGILAASGALTLLMGALYVARDSRISADGVDGVFYFTHDCDGAGGQAPGLSWVGVHG